MASASKTADFGLLLMRVFVGISVIIFGFAPLFEGPDEWGDMGKNLAIFGISYAPEFWGFVGCLVAVFGGILFTLGAFARTASVFLFLVSVVATVSQFGLWWNTVSGFKDWVYPATLAFVFLGFAFVGPGNMTVKSAVKSSKE